MSDKPTETAHIVPTGPIAERILLPGDPLRAKYIAEKFFDDAVQFNAVRNMLGFTGTYRGEQVSVMGTGMGIPSMSLYAYELIHFFDVKKLIRIGSIGSMQHHVNLYDLVIAQAVSTDSNFLDQFGLAGQWVPVGNFEMMRAAVESAEKRQVTAHVGSVLSSDIYYHANEAAEARWTDFGVLGCEMETLGLYGTASAAGVDALGIFTVSDHMLTGQETAAEERQNSFDHMVEVALDSLFA